MIPVPSRIFREYDIRGEAESDLTDENVLAIARAYHGRRAGKLTSILGDLRQSMVSFPRGVRPRKRC